MSSNTGRMILKYTDLSKLGLLLNISCSHFLGHGVGLSRIFLARPMLLKLLSPNCQTDCVVKCVKYNFGLRPRWGTKGREILGDDWTHIMQSFQLDI